MSAEILYEGNPKMFRNKPIFFILSLALIAAYGLGLLILLIWYFRTKAVKFKVTTDSVILREGFLSKEVSEINIQDIRKINTSQSFLQRIFGTGTLKISSSATAEQEISIYGFKKPGELKDIIRNQME